MPSLNTGNAILSNPIKVDSSYNVGIGGAASGSFKLQVTGTTNLTGALTGTSATFSGVITASSTKAVKLLPAQAAAVGLPAGSAISSTGNFSIYTDSGVAGETQGLYYWNGSTYYSALQTANVASGFSNLLLMKDGGNVGIGTSSPFAIADTNLTVNGTTSSAIQLGFNGTRYGQFYTDSGEIRLSAVANLPLTFYSNNLERMRITSGGNVLIGTSTAPSSIGVSDLLVIGKSGSASNAINFSNGSTTNWGYILAESGKMVFGSGSSSNITFETNGGSERMRITSGGNVLIGTTTDNGGKLQVNGVTQLRDTLVLVKQTSSVYNQTSTSGNTSIVDTGIFYNTAIIGYGQQSIYQITIAGNPQNAGSASYRNTILGYISIQTGFSGAVVQTITWNQIFSNDGGTFTPFTIAARFWNGTSEATSIADGTTNAQIRIKISGYAGSAGAQQDVRIVKITD